MKAFAWIEKTAGSLRARIVSFFFFLVLIGTFTFGIFRANANLAAARASQVSLVPQTKDVNAASSMKDFFDKGWLANDRNFIELAGYVDKLVHFSASPRLDPRLKQELGDYIRKNEAALPQESRQIEQLSFSDGILRQDQSRLLDMYDELYLVLQTMQDIITYWDQDGPMERASKMSTMQDSFSIAAIEFQATTSNHRKILNYARELDEQSQQANATELDRIQSSRLQHTLSLAGLIVSSLGFVGWLMFLTYRRRRSKKDFASLPG